MGLTQAQLLASLGARELPRDQPAIWHEVEHAGSGVRVLGEVSRSRDGTSIVATLCCGDAARPVLPFCIFQADATAGRFAVITFMVGEVNYLWGGAWSVFTEADACAFVRAVMRELEAGRMPDLDALLAVAEGSGPARVIDWRGR